MISKNSKKSKSPCNTYNTSLMNNSNNISYSDKVDDAECESLLEKDIQVCIYLSPISLFNQLGKFN